MEIDLCRVKSETQAIATSFTDRQFEDFNMAQPSLMACCLDTAFQCLA